MTLFLVNTLLVNKTIGEANTLNTVMHNLQLIGVDYKNDLLKELEVHNTDPMIQFVACGKYICVIVISKDKSKAQMTFIDTFNDYDRALELGHYLKTITGNSNYIKQFMEEFEKMKPVYELNKNACILDLIGNTGSSLN